MQHVVRNEIFKLIQDGKISDTIVTLKDVDLKYRGPLSVFAPGKEHEAVHFEVTSVMKVGHGYLAKGYPESERVTGSTRGAIAMRVKPLEAEPGIEPEEKLPTDAEGQE